MKTSSVKRGAVGQINGDLVLVIGFMSKGEELNGVVLSEVALQVTDALGFVRWVANSNVDAVSTGDMFKTLDKLGRLRFKHLGYSAEITKVMNRVCRTHGEKNLRY